jgi:hypothetical protein
MALVLNGTTGITNDGGYTGDGVVFADTTPANTLVTTTGGNVGIGTSSPSSDSLVHVFSASDKARVSVQRNGVSKAWFGQDGGGEAYIYNEANAAIRFYNNSTERARIDSSGNLLVGTTSTLSGYSDAYMHVATVNGGKRAITVGNSAGSSGTGCMTFVNSNGQVGYILTSGSTTTYATSSDYRLKNTIAPMTGALARVAALKPCTYKWNADGFDGEGFIAHELAEVVPQCVSGEKDAVDAEGKPQYQGIDTSFLVATLTAAIQEQQAIITALTARVEALEGTQP